MREIKSRDADEQQRDYAQRQRERAYWDEYANRAGSDVAWGCDGDGDDDDDQ